MASSTSFVRVSVFVLKAQAQQLQDVARAAGAPLKRSAALDAVARKHGFKDWNTASAAVRAKIPQLSPSLTEKDVLGATPHAPCHRYAVASLPLGHSDGTVPKDYVGHTTAAMIKHYLPVNSQRQDDAMRAFCNLTGLKLAPVKPWCANPTCWRCCGC